MLKASDVSGLKIPLSRQDSTELPTSPLLSPKDKETQTLLTFPARNRGSSFSSTSFTPRQLPKPQKIYLLPPPQSAIDQFLKKLKITPVIYETSYPIDDEKSPQTPLEKATYASAQGNLYEAFGHWRNAIFTAGCTTKFKEVVQSMVSDFCTFFLTDEKQCKEVKAIRFSEMLPSPDIRNASQFIDEFDQKSFITEKIKYAKALARVHCYKELAPVLKEIKEIKPSSVKRIMVNHFLKAEKMRERINNLREHMRNLKEDSYLAIQENFKFNCTAKTIAKDTWFQDFKAYYEKHTLIVPKAEEVYSDTINKGYKILMKTLLFAALPKNPKSAFDANKQKQMQSQLSFAEITLDSISVSGQPPKESCTLL